MAKVRRSPSGKAIGEAIPAGTADGQVPTWDNTAKDYVPQAPPGASSGTVLFWECTGSTDGNFLRAWGSDGANSPNPSESAIAAPFDGTLQFATASDIDFPSGQGGLDFTVLVEAAPSALVVSLPAGQQTATEDVTGVPVLRGQRITVQQSNTHGGNFFTFSARLIPA